LAHTVALLRESLGVFTIDCNPNEKVIGAGYGSNALVLNLVLSYL
jgi:hypothetical protein